MFFRTRARGNVRKALPRGKMNKLEIAFAQLLDYRRAEGDVAWWAYEAIKLRLVSSDKAFFTPDFFVMLSTGELICYEVKGHFEDDALDRLKFAAEIFPFKFVSVSRKRGGEWVEREFGVVK